MQIRLEPSYSDPLCNTYVWRSLLCVVWHAAPTRAGLRGLMRAMETMVPDNRPFVMCAIVSASLPAPDAEARKAVAETIERLGPRLLGSVNLIVGSGFQAAAVRAVLAGLAMLMRRKQPAAFVGTEHEAAAFLVNHWPATDAPAPAYGELARAIAALTPGVSGREAVAR